MWGIQRPVWHLGLFALFLFLSKFCGVSGRLFLLGGNSHWGVLLPWQGVLGLQWRSDRWCVSKSQNIALLRDAHCYSHHLSVALMLWLISVYNSLSWANLTCIALRPMVITSNRVTASTCLFLRGLPPALLTPLQPALARFCLTFSEPLCALFLRLCGLSKRDRWDGTDQSVERCTFSR